MRLRASLSAQNQKELSIFTRATLFFCTTFTSTTILLPGEKTIVTAVLHFDVESVQTNLSSNTQ